MNRKTFISAINELNAHNKAIRSFVKEKYINENGEAVVDLFVNKDNLYDAHSNPACPELDNSVFEYLDNTIYFIPIEYPIVVNLHSEDPTIDVNYVEAKIKEHYWKKLADKRDDLRKNALTSILLLALGVILFSLFFVFNYATEINKVVNEIFSIAATFCIWESVDFGLIIRQSLKIEQFNLAQEALIKVNKID